MTDQPQSPEQGMPAEPSSVADGVAAAEPTLSPLEPPPLAASSSSGDPSGFSAAQSAAGERLEIVAGAAFAGGFVLAMILKRLAR